MFIYIYFFVIIFYVYSGIMLDKLCLTFFHFRFTEALLFFVVFHTFLAFFLVCTWKCLDEIHSTTSTLLKQQCERWDISLKTTRLSQSDFESTKARAKSSVTSLPAMWDYQRSTWLTLGWDECSSLFNGREVYFEWLSFRWVMTWDNPIHHPSWWSTVRFTGIWWWESTMQTIVPCLCLVSYFQFSS